MHAVTPATKNTHQESEAISDLQQTCYRMQLSSLSPNQIQIQSTTAICTPNENGVNNFQAAIDHLAKEFCNDNKDSKSFSYSFFCNLQKDLDFAAANNFDDFFSIHEYLKILTLVNEPIWGKNNIFHCILNCESEYVLVYMDSHSFCLQIWASHLSSGNGTIQLFVDNFGNMLNVLECKREIQVLQNVFSETDRSEVCSFMTLLCHLFCIREGISKAILYCQRAKEIHLKTWLTRINCHQLICFWMS